MQKPISNTGQMLPGNYLFQDRLPKFHAEIRGNKQVRSGSQPETKLFIIQISFFDKWNVNRRKLAKAELENQNRCRQ
jgi:hypothetical protein